MSGSLSSNGCRYRVEAWIEDGPVAGSMSGSAGLLFFEAGRWENELWGMLHGSDAGGQDVITNGQVVGLVLEFASGET